MNLSQAQARYDAMLPPDDSFREAAAQREADAIADDPDRLLEAVANASSLDDDTQLAELRILLSNASYALARLFAGDTFDQATRTQASLDAMRELLRKAEDADKFVAQAVQQAADEVIY
jgi:hypothetical protein